MKITFKGTVSRDFRPSVFFINQPRALIHGLKPFRIWIRNRWEIRDNRLKLSASAVSMRPRKRIPGFQWGRGSGFGGFNKTEESSYRGILNKISTTLFLHRKVVFSTKLRKKKFGFRGLVETVEADLAVSMRPRKRIQRSQWDRGSWFSCVNEAAEADSAVSMRPQNPLWHRGSPFENEYRLSIPLKG
jgi:hypothetical protein